MLRNIFNLSMGTALSQAIMFAFAFILARFYDEKSFGELAVFLGIVSIIAIISVASYDKAIMFVKSQRRLRALVALIMMLTGFFTLLSAALLFVAHSFFPEQTGKLGAGIYWVPLGVAIAALFQVFQFTHLRDGAMRTLSIAKVAQSTATGTVQLILATAILIPGLIVGHLVGQGICVALVLVLLVRSGFRLSDLNPRRSAGTARKFQVYPRLTLPNELIDSASTQIQTVLIGVFFGLGTLGHYAFGLRILSAPAALVGQAVGQSFFHAIRGEDQTHASILSSMYRIWIGLAALAIIPFTILMLFGPEIFTFLFGKSWAFAGEIAQYSSPLLFVRFISSPTSTIYLKLNLQKKQIWFSISAFIYRIFPIFFYYIDLNFLNIIIFLSTVEIIAIIFYNYYAIYILRRKMVI